MHNISEGIKKKKAECWNHRLQFCLDNKNLTQTEFADRLNERYDTKFTQTTISDWLNVDNYRGNRKIGFPKYENMVLIAEYLEVDLGYLTGETDMETFTIKKVSEYTNLTGDAVNAILKITGAKRSCIDWGYHSEKYKGVLNNLLTSSEFVDFIKALGDMEDVYADKKKTQQPLKVLCEELGNELFDVACKYNGSCAEELEGLNLSEEEINAINLFDKAQDDSYSLYLKNEYDIKVSKYSVQEALTLLINGLYSSE